MGGTNSSIISSAFKDYKLYVQDKTEDTLREWCDDLLRFALEERLKKPQAHNFTGNLLNSIVIGLYRGGVCVYACYSAGNVPKAIRPKMSGPRKKRRYVFRPTDYEGVKESKYMPEVTTNKGYGADDAENFLMSYKPKYRCLFEIVVAYTVEYAEWVEMKRKTTGIILTNSRAETTGLTFMERN